MKLEINPATGAFHVPALGTGAEILVPADFRIVVPGNLRESMTVLGAYRRTDGGRTGDRDAQSALDNWNSHTPVAKMRQQRFFTAYLGNLLAARVAEPENYRWYIPDAPHIAARMVYQLSKGTALISRVVRETAREVGIEKPTEAAILRHLNGEQA